MAYYAHLTATSQLKVGLSKLKGIFASSGTSPTVAVYDTPDGDTNDPLVIAQFTAATPGSYIFTAEGISLNSGLYVVIGGTNPKVTIFYE
jgi:hypothetical protein